MIHRSPSPRLKNAHRFVPAIVSNDEVNMIGSASYSLPRANFVCPTEQKESETAKIGMRSLSLCDMRLTSYRFCSRLRIGIIQERHP